MKAKNLLKKAFLLLALVGGTTNAWATDYVWTFDAYCTTNNITAGNSGNIGTGGVIVSTSNTVNLKYIEGKANSSKMYKLSSAEGPTGDANYTSYLYMGGDGKSSTTNRCFTTGTITGRGQLTIIYKTGTGSFSVYDASSTSTPLATVSDLANSSAKSTSTLNLGEGKSLIIAHSGKCYIYAIKWTATSETAKTVSYTISPAAGGTVEQSPSGTSIEAGTEVSFAATANTGYKFVNWTDDNNGDAVLGTSATYTIASLSANTAITAHFEALNAITFSANGGSGDVPQTVYKDDGEDFDIPTWLHLYKEGYTFAGWKTGETTYTAGQTIENISDNVALAAQWNANSVALGNAATTASWKFGSNDGAPTISIEGSGKTKYYVTKATVSGSSIDVPLYIDANNGKFSTQADYAQVNAGTKFTLPAVPGMTVTYTSGAMTHEDVSKFAFDDNSNVSAEMSSNNLVFTYNGNNSTITFTDNDGSMWPTGISVSYPKYIPGPADAGNASVVLTYSNGSVSGKVWTGTTDTECEGYTISADASGSITAKNSTKYALGYGTSGATYTIAVPSGVKITSFKITGAANSSTSYVTYNETQKSFDNSGDTDQTWTVASPSAGGSIEFSVATKQLNVTSITLYTDDITLTTSANMAGWRAFYDASNGYTLDANTTAYIAIDVNDGVVKMKSISEVPAGTPVILKTTSSADNYKMTLTKASLEPYEDLGNLLTWETSEVSNKYRLGYGAEGVGFYPYSGTPSSGAVILDISSSSSRALRMSFGGITDINQVENGKIEGSLPVKRIVNGKLVIELIK